MKCNNTACEKEIDEECTILITDGVQEFYCHESCLLDSYISSTIDLEYDPEEMSQEIFIRNCLKERRIDILRVLKQMEATVGK